MKKWQQYLTPSQMGKVTVVVGILVIFLGIWGVMIFLEPEKKVRTVQPEIENIITNRNSRALGIDAVNDKVLEQNKMLVEQDKNIDSLRQDSEKLQNQVKEIQELSRSNRTLEKQMELLTKELSALKNNNKNNNNNLQPKSDQTALEDTANHSSLNVDPERRKVTGTSFSYGASAQTVTSQNADPFIANNNTSRVDKRTPELFAVIENEQKIHAQEKPEIYLPKGSILTGVLITGLDAPTAASSTDNPVPVLVRLKKEAILPNFATVNEVDECFALLAGYGDLSSERAMLRGESITCVRKDKSILEADFSGFAVGEDGKNGLKGTLVTRNSTVLANAMMSGFGAGLASMFDVNPVPVIATNSTGQQQYQDVFSSDAITGGAAKGASEAMTKLADYYMELADSIHPIIEVGAGRVVDMVVTKGTSL